MSTLLHLYSPAMPLTQAVEFAAEYAFIANWPACSLAAWCSIFLAFKTSMEIEV